MHLRRSQISGRNADIIIARVCCISAANAHKSAQGRCALKCTTMRRVVPVYASWCDVTHVHWGGLTIKTLESQWVTLTCVFLHALTCIGQVIEIDMRHFFFLQHSSPWRTVAHYHALWCNTTHAGWGGVDLLRWGAIQTEWRRNALAQATCVAVTLVLEKQAPTEYVLPRAAKTHKWETYLENFLIASGRGLA